MGKLPPLPDEFGLRSQVPSSTKRSRDEDDYIPVKGLYHCQIYITVHATGALSRILKEIEEYVWSALQDSIPDGRLENVFSQEALLHISLAQSFNLTRAELEPTLQHVRKCLQILPIFNLTFASVARFENESETKSFLALEVGAGYDHLFAMTREIDALGTQYSQPKYYDDRVRYHTSLLSTSRGNAHLLSDQLLETLNTKFRAQLRKQALGVNQVNLRFGKELHCIRLSV